MNKPKSLYELLNLPPTASTIEINEAYQAYANALIELQHAHDVLVSEERRKIYDAIMDAALTPTAFPLSEKTPTHSAEPATSLLECPETLFFDPPQPTYSKPVYIAFFETPEGVLIPCELETEDTYVPLISRPPLDRVFTMISSYLHPMHTVKRTGIKAFHSEGYFCEKRIENDNSYILVRAPSAVEMANLLTDTILITAVHIELFKLDKPILDCTVEEKV